MNLASDKALFILFAGMLVYKVIDLFALTYKYEQAVLRAAARKLHLNLTYGGTLRRVVSTPPSASNFAIIRRVRAALPSQYRWYFHLQETVALLHRRQAVLIATPLLLTFFWFGVAVNYYGTAGTSLIVGVGTFVTSLTASGASLLLERYRALAEHL